MFLNWKITGIPMSVWTCHLSRHRIPQNMFQISICNHANHCYPAEEQDKWHKHNLMSLNSWLLGSASFPHCFNKQHHGSLVFGVFRLPSTRCSKKKIQKAGVLSGIWPNWPVRNNCSRGVTDVNSLLTLSMSNTSLAKKADFKQQM